MLCPECRDPMLIVEWEGVEVDVCWQRHGLWLDADEVVQLLARAGVDQDVADLERRLDQLPRTGKGKRRCPRCRRRMVEVRHEGGLMLDRCLGGHGTWFDEGELESLLAAELGEESPAFVTVMKRVQVWGASRPQGREKNDA